MNKYLVVFKVKHILSVMSQVIECETSPDNKQAKDILTKMIKDNDYRINGELMVVTNITSIIQQ